MTDLWKMGCDGHYESPTNTSSHRHFRLSFFELDELACMTINKMLASFLAVCKYVRWIIFREIICFPGFFFLFEYSCALVVSVVFVFWFFVFRFCDVWNTGLNTNACVSLHARCCAYETMAVPVTRGGLATASPKCSTRAAKEYQCVWHSSIRI